MTDFFEPPPPRRYEFKVLPPAEWDGPPRGELPAVVPAERVIARTEEIAVFLTNLWVFTTGFGFEIFAAAREENGLDHLRREPDLEALRTGSIPAEKLRLGIEFLDGSTATNIRDAIGLSPDPPVLRMTGGLYGENEWEEGYWVWPLPSKGPLTLVCEWPAAGIPLTRTQIDAESILEAASRAQSLFADA